MTNTRESIVFCVDADKSAPLTIENLKGSLDAIGFASDLESLVFEVLANCVVGNVLLKRNFGIVVDLN